MRVNRAHLRLKSRSLNPGKAAAAAAGPPPCAELASPSSAVDGRVPEREVARSSRVSGGAVRVEAQVNEEETARKTCRRPPYCRTGRGQGQEVMRCDPRSGEV